MTRTRALALSIILVTTIPMPAQTHQQAHQHPSADHSEHGAIDPELHAVLHSLMDGTWSGTLESPGASKPIGLELTLQERGQLTLRITGDVAFGSSGDLVIDRGTLRWTQDMSGRTCKASAQVIASTSSVRESLKGTMLCDHPMTFVLYKMMK